MMEEKYLRHFDESITEEIEHFAYETALSQSRYIFVKKEKGQYIGHCTNCGEEFGLYTAKHKEIDMCPVCKCSAQIRMVNYSRKYFKDEACFIRYDKSKIDNETLIARAFYIIRDYSGNYIYVKTRIVEIARYIFSPEGSKMFEKRSWWGRGNYNWHEMESICRYNRDSLSQLKNYIDWRSLEEATKNNRFQYSMYELMGKEDQYASMTKYFEFYNKYPIIEKIIKIGFINLVKVKLLGNSLQNCVNWKQKEDVFKFLKLNRAEVREIVSSKVKITPSFLNLYRKNVKEKWKLTCHDLKDIEHFNYRWYRKDITYYTSWNKALKYINKQFNKYGKWDVKEEVLNTWIDYLCDCEKLKLDAKKDESILFPKDLYRQHQNFIAQIKYEADEALRKGFEKQKKRREKFNFNYNQLIFVPANSQSELIEEGKVLHHCVGGYAKMCSEGETDIIFIRKECEPNKSFVTMEVTKNKVVQVKAAHNKKPPEDVLDAVEQFKIQVLSKLSKKKSKRKKKVA